MKHQQPLRIGRFATDRVDVDDDANTVADMRSLVIGCAVAAVALAGLDGTVAIVAQRAGAALLAPEGYASEGYPLAWHLISMVLLAALAVATAAALVRRGSRVLALLVVVLVAAGPMAVVAAPFGPSAVLPSTEGAVTWWRLTVGVPQASIMLATVFWVLRTASATAAGPDRDARRSDLAVFAVVAAAALALQVLAGGGGMESTGPAAMLGWAALAGGLALPVLRWAPIWVPVAALLSGALVMGTMSLAYYRPGGWPGAAGWETFGTNPLVLSWATPVVILAVPLARVVIVALSRITTASAVKPTAS